MADLEQAAASAVDDGQFDAGFKGENVPVKTAKPAPAEAPRAEEKPDEPEYVQISAKDWAEVRAAAAKTASYDQQLSKAFGTIGNLQKLVNNFQAQTPTGRKVEIPKDAFAAMERDFPELAAQTRSALEAALSGITGTGASDVDPAKLESVMASYTAKREIEALEDAYPEWRGGCWCGVGLRLDAVLGVRRASGRPSRRRRRRRRHAAGGGAGRRRRGLL